MGLRTAVILLPRRLRNLPRRGHLVLRAIDRVADAVQAGELVREKIEAGREDVHVEGGGGEAGFDEHGEFDLVGAGHAELALELGELGKYNQEFDNPENEWTGE